MYLPLAAAIALLALAWRIAGDGLEKRGILAANVRRTVDSAALVVVALLLGAATFARNEDYRSQVAMWTEAASTRPSNARAWHNLAVALVDEDRRSEAVEPFRTAARLKPDAGQYAALAQCLMEIGRPGEAAVEFQKALELLPVSRGSLRSTPASLHFDLATALVDANRPERVEEHLRESLRLEPANAPARNVLGLVLARQSKYDEAVVELRRAIELEPGFIAARDNLGTVHFKSGNLPAAIAAYETALALHPDASRVIHNLAHAYFRLGNRERAESHFREGRRLDPNGARVAARSAWVLACHSDAVRRDPVEAVRLAELAVEATNRRDPICLDAAATAYAAMGRFNDAVDEARTARDLIAPVDPRAAAAIASRLRLYERGEAYRDPP